MDFAKRNNIVSITNTETHYTDASRATPERTMSDNKQLKKGDIALTGVGYILVIGHKHKNNGMLHTYALIKFDETWKLESTNIRLQAHERVISETDVTTG